MSDSSQPSKTSRRGFCAGLLAAVPALALASRAQGQAEPTKPVDPASQMAVALGYVADASKVDLVKFPKRAGPEGQKQFCSNCMFLQKMTDEKAGLGKCSLFLDGLVAKGGWCNSWSAKLAT